MTTLDQLLPHYDFNEIHSVRVKASPEKTMAAVRILTPSELSPLIGILLGLRDLPSHLAGHTRATITKTRPFLDQLEVCLLLAHYFHGQWLDSCDVAERHQTSG
jgi:hypothetical protein